MKALIIGFEYSESSLTHLEGVLFDVYQIYRFCDRLKFSSITIITDKLTHLTNYSFYNPLSKNLVDVGIIFFRKDLIEGILPKTRYITYSNASEISKCISETLTDTSYSLIYYTGHGRNGQMILPDKSTIKLDSIPRFLKKSSNNLQLFLILDCCQSNGANLPWKVGVSGVSLSSRNAVFTKSGVICISSSDDGKESKSNTEGSFFTQTLLEFLPKNFRIQNLYEILSRVCLKKYDQYPTIYLSHPDIKHNWSWVVAPIKLSINIVRNSMLQITPKYPGLKNLTEIINSN